MNVKWTSPRRQPPTAVWIMAIRVGRLMVSMVWPIILVSLLGNKRSNASYWIWGLAAVFVFICVRALLEYLRFRFSVQQDQLIITQGIFSRKTTTIPLVKIQAVHLEQSLLHTLTHTCRVMIDTAGSDKVEVSIYALEMSEAIAFKELVLEDVSGAAASVLEEKPLAKPLIQLATRDLLKLSLSANHIETLALIAAFILSRLEDVGKYLKIEAFGWIEAHSKDVEMGWEVITSVVVLILLLTILASAIRIIIRFYGFNVQADGKGFYLKWGLLQVKQKMIPFSKVQMMVWSSNFIRRFFDMYVLQLKATAEDDLKKKQKLLLPITHSSQLAAILPFYEPELPAVNGTAHRIQKAFINRTVLWKSLMVVVVTTLMYFTRWGWFALWLLLWCPYFMVTTVLKWRTFRFWVSDSSVQLLQGILGKEHTVLKWNKVQFVTLRRSLYQKKHAMATLVLHTAGGKVEIPYLQEVEARFLADYALYKIESSGRNWM